MGQFRVPLGIPKVVMEGSIATVVTFGSCVRIAQKATKQLKELNIHIELIDVQSLLPFDLNR